MDGRRILLAFKPDFPCDERRDHSDARLNLGSFPG